MRAASAVIGGGARGEVFGVIVEEAHLRGKNWGWVVYATPMAVGHV